MRSKASGVMALTADLVASVPQVLEDAGPLPTAAVITDEDYKFFVRATLAQRPPGALWVFAYGSLLWNPACDVAEVGGAVVQGWHRSFCFRAGRFRASPERPGLMLALD